MAKDSKIEWTHHTANLWWGCTEVHAGCDNCYARVLSNRWDNDLWGADKPRREIKSVWKDLARFQRLAKEKNEVHRVFVGSMMDIFEKPMPMIDSKGKIVSHPIMDGKDPKNELGYSTGDLRSFFFAEITNGSYPNLMFLLLTKRPGNINKYIPKQWKTNPPENVMFGTSPVDQKTYDRLIPQLEMVKGRKFLSIEPQLGKIDLTHKRGIFSIDWIIQGGESGHHKRPFDTEWAVKTRDQCYDLLIPYFFKQIDKVKPIPEYLLIHEFPDRYKQP